MRFPSEKRCIVPWQNSTAYFVILILFAISNGWLTSLLMMRGVTEDKLNPDEVDVAASILLLYLTAGLAVGAAFSFVSFPWAKTKRIGSRFVFIKNESAHETFACCRHG